MEALASGAGDPVALAAATVSFLGDVRKGFSPSAFGDDLEREAREGCTAKRLHKPATIQSLARFLVDEPDHHGVAKVFRRVAELKGTDPRFAAIETDCRREFLDAVRLGDFETPDAGLAEITSRRTNSRPKPPEKAISIIHKAKGLECRQRNRNALRRQNLRGQGGRLLSPLCRTEQGEVSFDAGLSRDHPSPLFII
jgi:hypothetical protein